MNRQKIASGKRINPQELRAPATRHTSPQPSHHRDGVLSINLYNSRSENLTIASGLYTPDERRRRDTSKWTIVQGVLAPIQFAVFLCSLGLVVRYLLTGDGLVLATTSIIIKTILLYTIMVTGSIWEREVFGRYLFARSFFWEDVFSMVVIALHTAYLGVLVTNALDARGQMMIALAAYGTYFINATQFLLKLRAARRESTPPGLPRLEVVR